MRKLLVVAVLILIACSEKDAPIPESQPVASSMPQAASTVSQATAQQTESQKQEADEIAKSEGLVERKGRTLVFHLQSGKALELVDSEKCEDYESCRAYIYRGLVADKQFFWISTSLYEGGGDSLVSRKSGQEVYLVRAPHVSPDNKFVVSTSEELVYESAGVWLWAIIDGELVSKYKFESEDHQLFRFVRWVDPGKIELIKIAVPPEGQCPKNKLLTEAEYSMGLVNKNGNWTLESKSDVGKCFSRFKS